MIDVSCFKLLLKQLRESVLIKTDVALDDVSCNLSYSQIAKTFHEKWPSVTHPTVDSKVYLLSHNRLKLRLQICRRFIDSQDLFLVVCELAWSIALGCLTRSILVPGHGAQERAPSLNSLWLFCDWLKSICMCMCFPALGTGCLFYLACFCLHISLAWLRLRIFPRLVRVAYFPATGSLARFLALCTDYICTFLL